MNRTVKAALSGVVLSLLILGVGQFLAVRNAAHVSDLVAQCEAEPKPQVKGAPWEIDDLACNPRDLLRVGVENLKGVQRELAVAQRDLGDPFETASSIAGLVLFLSLIPYGWHFFLRRIRELSNAVTGK